MTNKPLVSIIMNCYNGEKFLKYSVKSIINQKYTNWELIFWDNKSTDNSAKILKEFKDKRIKYFYAKKKTVLYKARNLALKKAKGKFIAFLDVDDLWTKDKLSKQIPKFKDKKVGLVYSNFYKYYSKRKKAIAFKDKLPTGFVTNSIIKNYQVGFLTVVLRNEFTKKNSFDYRYDLLSDYDFVLFFSLKFKFACINKPLGFYRIHDQQFQKLNMIKQAKQFCNWYKKKNIKKKFKRYDLSTINKKIKYYDLIKDINKSKIDTLIKIFNDFDLLNLIKILIIIFLPKKFYLRFMSNV